MTTFPKHPAMKAAAAIAQHGRDATRAHVRLDQNESTLSQHAAQIATANTNITTNTTNIAANTTAITTANTNITANSTNLAALNTRLGGSAQETFLGSLQQATAPSNPAHSGVGTVGHIGTAPTQAQFNSLIDDYNATNTAFNNAVDTIATLISRLDATNILQ